MMPTPHPPRRVAKEASGLLPEPHAGCSGLRHLCLLRGEVGTSHSVCWRWERNVKGQGRGSS